MANYYTKLFLSITNIVVGQILVFLGQFASITFLLLTYLLKMLSEEIEAMRDI